MISLFYLILTLMKITDIFFDLDRTLWDFDLNAENTLIELCQINDLKNLGIDTKDFIYSYTNHNEKLWSKYRKNLITKEMLRSEPVSYTHLTLPTTRYV